MERAMTFKNENTVVCEYGDCCERAYMVRGFAFFHPRDRKLIVKGKNNLVRGAAVIALCVASDNAETCTALLASIKRAGGIVPMERGNADFYTTVKKNLNAGAQLLFCPELLTRRYTVTQEESYALAAQCGVPVVPMMLFDACHLSVQPPVYPCADLSESENASYMAYAARMENRDAYANNRN